MPRERSPNVSIKKRSKNQRRKQSKLEKELQAENQKLKEDISILKSALCSSCKTIDINETRIHLENCQLAKISLKAKPTKGVERAKTEINLHQGVSRSASLPTKRTDGSLPKPEIPTLHFPRRKKSNQVTYPKPEIESPQPKIVSRKKIPQRMDSFTETKSNETVTDTDEKSTSQFSSLIEDELELYSSPEDVSHDDGYIPDKYISSTEVSEASENSTSFDMPTIVKKLRMTRKYIQENEKQKALHLLTEMEDHTCQAILLKTSKINSKTRKYGKLLQLVQTKNIKEHQIKWGNRENNEDTNQQNEIQIRVDQTSILNSSQNQSSVLSPRQISGKIDKKSQLTRCSSFHRDSKKNIIDHSTFSQELAEERFLTFSILENGRKTLKTGHVLDILEWIVNNEEATLSEMRTFLFSFRIASTPILLFNTLSILYRFSFNPQRAQQIFKMISLWIRMFYVYDFHFNKDLSEKLWDFVKTNFPSKFKVLRKYSTSWQNVHWDIVLNDKLEFVIPFPCSISILDQNPRDIAKQLTIIEWKYFKHFNIFDCFCDDKPNSKVPTLMVNQFNRISGWVASSILSASRSKKRSMYIKFFINVAKHLFELKNFNGMMEITSGLDSTAVGRLKKTWRIIKKNHEREYEQFSQLSELMSPKENYKDYRSVLQEVRPPCIPFFGVISRDITLVNVGNETFIKSLLNFEKCAVLWKVCGRVLDVQKTDYNLTILPLLHSYLSYIPQADEHLLYEKSILLEPIIN